MDGIIQVCCEKYAYFFVAQVYLSHVEAIIGSMYKYFFINVLTIQYMALGFEPTTLGIRVSSNNHQTRISMRNVYLLNQTNLPIMTLTFCKRSNFLNTHCSPIGFQVPMLMDPHPPQLTSCRSPTCSLTSATGINLRQGLNQLYPLPRSLGSMGEQSVANLINNLRS